MAWKPGGDGEGLLPAPRDVARVTDAWARLAWALGYDDPDEYDRACEDHPAEVRTRLAALTAG